MLAENFVGSQVRYTAGAYDHASDKTKQRCNKCTNQRPADHIPTKTQHRWLVLIINTLDSKKDMRT